MSTSLDLHGVRHAEVSDLMDRFLYIHIVRKTSQVTIITGNSIAMKAKVNEVLSEYNLSGKEGFWNRGELKVDLLT